MAARAHAASAGLSLAQKARLHDSCCSRLGSDCPSSTANRKLQTATCTHAFTLKCLGVQRSTKAHGDVPSSRAQASTTCYVCYRIVGLLMTAVFTKPAQVQPPQASQSGHHPATAVAISVELQQAAPSVRLLPPAELPSSLNSDPMHEWSATERCYVTR